MTCAWFKANVQAYAVGALDAGDRASMERHLEGDTPHEGCFELLAEALESVHALDLALPAAAPGNEVWSKIAAAVDEPGKVTELRPEARRTPWREAVAWTALLAASIVVMTIYRLNQDLEERVESGEQQISRMHDLDSDRSQCLAALEHSRASSETSRAILALLEHPSTRVVSFQAQGGRSDRASAIVNAEIARAYLVSAALPQIPGRDYQLWVIRGAGAPIPAGFVRVQADGGAVGEFSASLLSGGAPSALAVSLEPKGGRPTPTEVILVAKL